VAARLGGQLLQFIRPAKTQKNSRQTGVARAATSGQAVRYASKAACAPTREGFAAPRAQRAAYRCTWIEAQAEKKNVKARQPVTTGHGTRGSRLAKAVPRFVLTLLHPSLLNLPLPTPRRTWFLLSSPPDFLPRPAFTALPGAGKYWEMGKTRYGRTAGFRRRFHVAARGSGKRAPQAGLGRGAGSSRAEFRRSH